MVKPLTERLLHRKLPAALLIGAHVGKLREESAYDAPPTYRASCSCAWEVRVVAGSSARPVPGAEPYVAAYGDGIFLDEGAIYGTEEAALALLLQHMAPDFTKALFEALRLLQAHRKQGAAIEPHGNMKLLKEHTRKLMALIGEYELLQEVYAFHLSTPAPPLQTIPTAHRLAAQQLSKAFYSTHRSHPIPTKDIP